MDFVATTLFLALLAPQDSRPQDPGQAAREAAFARQLSGCKMVGKFTLRGSKKPPQSDSYTIAKVVKLRSGKWRFDAKIEYGDKSVRVPLVVDVKWAGDTPVIQVTDMAVPMLGTYSARVVVYDGEYAGVWSGKGYGGQMFGRIERGDAKPAASEPGTRPSSRPAPRPDPTPAPVEKKQASEPGVRNRPVVRVAT